MEAGEQNRGKRPRRSSADCFRHQRWRAGETCVIGTMRKGGGNAAVPQIIFWNVQRAGNAVGPLTLDNLEVDLISLITSYNPDLLILCEGLKGLGHAIRLRNIPKYEVVKPDKGVGDYRKDTTLRYVVLQKRNYGVQTHLVDSGAKRPALLICMPGYNVIALHAPSVSKSVTPQTDQMKTAFDRVVGAVPGCAVTRPCMIFGDLNIDALDSSKMTKMRNSIAGSSLGTFKALGTGQTTQKAGGSLDWALCAQGFRPSVSAIATGKRKRAAAATGRAAKRRKTDMDDFIVDDDEESDAEDEFSQAFGGEKGADHKPLLITWR